MVLGSNEILARAPVVKHRTRERAEKMPLGESFAHFARAFAAREPSQCCHWRLKVQRAGLKIHERWA